MRAATFLLFALAACASGPIVRDAASGEPVSVAAIADALHDRDVVFLGEQHDSDEGHRLQLAIVQALAERRPRLAITMEMFERDVQGVIDDYLAGRIDEASFLQRSRPWRDYRDHYRPIVELARARKWPVIAANLPTELARKVGREGPGAVGASPHAARSTSAPKDRYWEAFTQVMGDHVGSDRMWQMYQAQCFKDDTMAESIVAVRKQGGGPAPLVVHLCGAFHSNYRLGTVARVLEREPGLRVGVLSMVPAEPDPDDPEVKLAGAGPIGDYVVAVRGEPRRRVAQPVARAQTPATQPAASRAHDPHADPHVDPHADPRAGGRPALGLMPDYNFDGDGLRIDRVSEGGAAANAGLKDGDVIVQLAGQDVTDVQGYMAVLGGLRPGQKTTVVVQRDGVKKSLEVTIGQRAQ
jgi:uncharacterized iron-regulated protein